MKRKPTYDIVLFVLLMVLLFLPLLQGRFQLIPLKPLHGVTLEAEKPQLDKASYQSGDFAKQEEAYVSQHFGFREPVIRLYNQYLWSCYRKTYAHDVTAGKHGWLFYPESVRDYYGHEMWRWQPSAEQAKANFDLDAKYMSWVRSILKENGVELLAFMAPEKGALYSEYLPDDERDTTSFNARAYFEQRFIENGFPCIEMTRWFEQMKDTVAYPLIPQTGAHWLFPSVYAADSLFRLMGELKGEALPKLHIGTLHESDNHGADNDLEQLLNLSLPIWKRNGYSPTAEVTVTCDSTTTRPRVLFIGNSFFWAFANYVPLEEVFDNVEFWYYFSTAFFGEGLKGTTPVIGYDFLEKLMDFDYIVWFNTGNQMNKGTMGFSKTALLSLCASDSLIQAYTERIADTLSFEGSDSARYMEARAALFNHPELIPELNGDTLPTLRNKELPYVRILKEVRSDSLWLAALEAQGFVRTATLYDMLLAEAERIKEGKPLYRDQKAEIAFGQRCLQEVETLKQQMLGNEETMAAVRQKAEKYDKTLEKALDDDARWLIRRRYKLDHCRLIDDPDAEIPLPPDFQSN